MLIIPIVSSLTAGNVEWFTRVQVRFNRNVLSAAQIVNLFNTAGFGVGIGEWRSEKDGQYGSFHVATEAEMRVLFREAA